jgi:hypothetical protein
MLVLDNGSDQAVRGDSGWASQAITLLVPGDAARLVFGALLRGTGEMEVRGLRLDTLAASIDTVDATGVPKTVLDSAREAGRPPQLLHAAASDGGAAPRVGASSLRRRTHA